MSEPDPPPPEPRRRATARGGVRWHRVDVARIDTDALPEGDRTDAYLDAISHVLTTTFLPGAFRARISGAYLGTLHLIGSTITPRRSERTSAQIAKDRYDGLCAQVTIAGRSIGTTGGRRFVSEPGNVVLLDFAQPFAMTDQDERTTIHVSFPRALLLPRYGDPRDLHGRVLEATASDLLGSHMQATARRMADLTEAAAAALGDTMVDLLMTVLDAGPAAGAGRPIARRDILAARARRLIDARLGSSDLTPDQLMARLNISRSDLYALFEDAGGVSRFIWRRRLEAARDALMDGNDTRRIGEIAFVFGFSSEAHFSRAFRQAFDMTPSAMRRDGKAALAKRQSQTNGVGYRVNAGGNGGE